MRFEGSRCPYLAYNIPRIRVADEDLVMDQDTYDSMIRKRDNVNYSWEKRISKYTIDDVNEDAFEEYLRKAKEAGRIAFEDTDAKRLRKNYIMLRIDLVSNFEKIGRRFWK